MNSADDRGPERPPRPATVVCPVCGDSYEHEWDGEDWVVDTEWWATDKELFLDSRRCWLLASGYVFSGSEKRWVKPG